MKIILKDDPLLHKNSLSYAVNIESQILDSDTLRLTGRYNINCHELILIGAKPLSSYKGTDDSRRLLLLKRILGGKRIYFCRIYASGTENCFAFSPPEQVSFEIEKAYSNKLRKINRRLGKKQKTATASKAHTRRIDGYLEQINRETTGSLIKAAGRDFDFVMHFNTEMFHQNLTAKGLAFTKETAIGIYSDERYTKIIDLSVTRERLGFISLYAIAFYGLSLGDLYSIDSIFSLDVNREADEKKRAAGQDVFNLIFNENREEIQKQASVMATALRELPLLEINSNLNTFNKKNYALYCGIGDVGRVFSRLILSLDKSFEEAVKTARRLSYYRMLEKYYDEVAKTGTVSDKSELHKSVRAFANAVAGKKTAGELDFAVRGTQHFPLLNK
jgi:hypothetical protein